MAAARIHPTPSKHLPVVPSHPNPQVTSKGTHLKDQATGLQEDTAIREAMDHPWAQEGMAATDHQEVMATGSHSTCKPRLEGKEAASVPVVQLRSVWVVVCWVVCFLVRPSTVAMEVMEVVTMVAMMAVAATSKTAL